MTSFFDFELFIAFLVHERVNVGAIIVEIAELGLLQTDALDRFLRTVTDVVLVARTDIAHFNLDDRRALAGLHDVISRDQPEAAVAVAIQNVTFS